MAEIHYNRALEDQRTRRLLARREGMRRLDQWLDTVESMLEEDRRTVPEPLVREIACFVRQVNPRLHRSLLRNRTRDAARVLDVLFDAQEAILPRSAELAS